MKYLVLALSLLLSACATLKPSIVKKPEINQIKKIAIVSITAPQRVPHKSGRGEVAGWGAENRKVIADQALAAYVAQFGRLGWTVQPVTQLAALPTYQENFAPKLSKSDSGVGKGLNALSSMDAENTYFSPTGLYPVVWQDEATEKSNQGALRVDWGSFSLEKIKDLKSKMQELAAKAGVDAAVLVQADFCYDDGAIWVGHAGSGTGSAVITGAAAVYAVTAQGVEVIKMKRLAGACTGEPRFASDSATVMAKGQLLYSAEKIQKMFQEVSQKFAAENVRQIHQAMKQ